MTVLVGLRCVDGAVLACDSQETRVNYFRFWPKVNLIENHFVTLYAGNPTIGEAFNRRLATAFRDASKEAPLDRAKAVELIEESLILLAKEAGCQTPRISPRGVSANSPRVSAKYCPHPGGFLDILHGSHLLCNSVFAVRA